MTTPKAIKFLSAAELVIHDKLLAHHKAATGSRVQSIVTLGGTGTVRKQRCELCGSEGPTSSAKYAETKSSLVWREEHVRSHLVDLDAELVAHDARHTGRGQ